MNIQTQIRSDATYDEDFTAWLLEQAKRLRAHDAGALDWENLAEEIESLGLSQQRELRSRIQIILIHAIKLMLSQDEQPRAGWKVTIMTQRAEIDGLLRQSPSLNRRVPDIAAEVFDKARKLALAGLEVHEPSRMPTYRTAAATLTPPTAENLLDDDWFPKTPAH